MSGRLMPPKMPSRTLANGCSLSMMYRRTGTSSTCSVAMGLPSLYPARARCQRIDLDAIVVGQGVGVEHRERVQRGPGRAVGGVPARPGLRRGPGAPVEPG